MRGEGWVSIMRKGKDGKSTPSLSVSSLDGTIELVVATTNDPRYSILSNGALQTGRWNHIGVTISRSAVVLYLNGFQDSMRNFDSKVIVFFIYLVQQRSDHNRSQRGQVWRRDVHRRIQAIQIILTHCQSEGQQRRCDHAFCLRPCQTCLSRLQYERSMP